MIGSIPARIDPLPASPGQWIKLGEDRLDELPEVVGYPQMAAGPSLAWRRFRGIGVSVRWHLRRYAPRQAVRDELLNASRR